MVTISDLKKQLKAKTNVDPDSYYPTSVLREKGFERHECVKCKAKFWSMEEADVCGDPECGSDYAFIGNPVGKRMTFIETWKSFSSFFEKRGYKPIDRYPVAARWRDDTDFVQASIYDFQPHVVSGEVKPPANPLVVPQYCVRFNDVENVGITGRHNTGFVMVGQHAFMQPDEFDQPKYFRDLFEWFTEEVKIPAGEIKVHESQWGGGGNMGVCMEFFVRGLELGNQVYMLYKTTDEGYEPLNLKVLDMGMGQNRVTWLTNGTNTVYDCTYPGVCEKLFKKAGVYPDDVFREYASLAGPMDINASDSKKMDEVWREISGKMGISEKQLKESVLPVAAIYSIADHAQSLLFTLGDGVLPSNVGGGYNLRAILRRCLSFIDQYGWDIKLADVCAWHADDWKAQYPELPSLIPNVSKIISFEEKKYMESSEKAKKKVSAVIQKTSSISFEEMFRLYESDGITPELIEDMASKEGIEVTVPNDFYKKVSSMHEATVHEKKKQEYDVSGLPTTERLYHEDIFEFKAYVLKDWTQDGRHYVVLDKTAFYPESGGQDFDTGFMDIDRVINVQKSGDIIVHSVEGNKTFTRGTLVNCKVDKARRTQLMRHHTATHIINGAARRVLGDHVWQAGSEKKTDRARLDITHYEIPTEEQMREIELLSNRVISEARKVTKTVISRGEAEKLYGFHLYQGGAVPSIDIRVVDIEGWDVEACGGTHADSTSEIEQIKLLRAKKIQDGVVRLEYVAGFDKIRETQEKMREDDSNKTNILIRKIAELSPDADVDGKTYADLEEIYKNELRLQKEKTKSAASSLDVSEDVSYFESAPFKEMQAAGRAKVRENPESFAIILSNGAVFGIRGEDCSIDVEKYVNEACVMLGGKCGSRGNEFTGGGPNKEKTKEAYERVKSMLR